MTSRDPNMLRSHLENSWRVEIETQFQRTANGKWHMGNQMVT